MNSPTRTHKVVHLTSVHSRFDVRIFLKECRSLAKAGFDVGLVVADGNGDESIDDVVIHDVGPKAGRIHRMTRVSRKVLAKALALDADLFHLHDPELLTIAGALRRAGKTVIFDSHEDTAAQIFSKPYIPRALRSPLAKAYKFIETRSGKNLHAIVGATPAISETLNDVCPITVNVNNFPILDPAEEKAPRSGARRKQVCFVGGISEHRGIREVTAALSLSESAARLVLCGTFGDEKLASELKAGPSWLLVDELGWVNRADAAQVMRDSSAGLVVFQNQPNHVNAQPNKMFEYMSAGLPVISSDFPLWREIITSNDCGVCVDPADPEAIAKAIDFFVENPAEADRMGANGQRAVRERYNWAAEEKKLIALYDQVCGRVSE